jgi:hypothetical protein
MSDFITNSVSTALIVLTNYLTLPGNNQNPTGTNPLTLQQPLTCKAMEVVNDTTRIIHYRTTNYVELTPRVTNGPPVWRPPEGPPPLPVFPTYYPSRQ